MAAMACVAELKTRNQGKTIDGCSFKAINTNVKVPLVKSSAWPDHLSGWLTKTHMTTFK